MFCGNCPLRSPYYPTKLHCRNHLSPVGEINLGIQVSRCSGIRSNVATWYRLPTEGRIPEHPNTRTPEPNSSPGMRPFRPFCRYSTQTARGAHRMKRVLLTDLPTFASEEREI